MRITGRHIHDFIEALPGGNPTQYSRLLGISPMKMRSFLYENRLAQGLIRNGKIKANTMGSMPKWAVKNTERGFLTKADIPTDHQFIARVCGTLPEAYREDAHHIFAMLVEMTTGSMSVTKSFNEIVAPFTEIAARNVELEARVAGYEREIAYLQKIVDLRERIAAPAPTALLTAVN